MIQGNASKTLPSEVLKGATVTLLGLSYGEHDGGSQRREICTAVAHVLEKWTSGLLAADYSAAEVNAVTDAFDDLMLSRDACTGFEWPLVPTPVLDHLVSMYWKLSVRRLDERSDAVEAEAPLGIIPASEPLTDPVQRAVRALTVALAVLEVASASGEGRRCAATATPAHFLFASTRLDESFEQYDLAFNTATQKVLKATRAHIQQQQRLPTAALLFSRAISSLARVATAAINVDTSRTDGHHALRAVKVAPAIAVLRRALDICLTVHDEDVDRGGIVGGSNVDNVVEALADLLVATRTCIDDMRSEFRVPALDVILMLHTRLPSTALDAHANELIVALPSALLWCDVASTRRAAPLLATLAPATLRNHAHPPPLAEGAPSAWQGAMNALLSAAQHHVDQSMLRFSGQPQPSNYTALDGNDTPVDHAIAAAIVLPLIPPLAQHRLVAYADSFIRAACKLLPRAAALARSACSIRAMLPPSAVDMTADALCDGLARTWCRSPSLRAAAFGAALAAVMEVDDADDDIMSTVRAASRKVVMRLATIDAPTVDMLLDEARLLAMKYPSLYSAGSFLNNVKPAVSQAVEQHARSLQRSQPGPLIRRFFTHRT